MLRAVKAQYLGALEVPYPLVALDADVTLHVWRNPETGRIVAIDNMELDAARNYISDPYDPDVLLVFEDTFTGLPK